MAQQLESFEDEIVEEEAPDTSDNQGYENTDDVDPGLDTFDNMNSQVNLLDEKEAPSKKEEEDKDAPKEDEDEKEGDKETPGKSDEDKEGEKEDEDAPKEEKIAGKTLKLFQDGKKFEVPTDATVKVKVNGRNEKVTVQELRDNYSGRVAYDKKFSELDGKSKSVESKEIELNRVQSTIKDTLEGVTTSLKDAMESGANPMDAVSKIVDMLNIDSYDFNKALLESMTDELINLDQMDEYERRAHWAEKRNDHLQKKHESFEDSLRETKAQEERHSRVDQIREASGVSEEDFVSAYEELSQSNDNLDPEQVIQYAANLPHLEAAEDLLTPYEDQLDDNEFEGMMAKIATSMKSDPSVTREDIAVYLAEVFEVENIINQANTKAGRLGAEEGFNSKRQVPSQQSHYSNSNYESFDDFN